MIYGIYDTVDECWMGQGPDGPNTYTDEGIARAAATVCGQMFLFPVGRIRALPFDTNRPVVLKDCVESVMPSEEAIDQLTGKEEK